MEESLYLWRSGLSWSLYGVIDLFVCLLVCLNGVIRKSNQKPNKFKDLIFLSPKSGPGNKCWSASKEQQLETNYKWEPKWRLVG